jgi:membrane protein implicated in regulation of membrane protease activity
MDWLGDNVWLFWIGIGLVLAAIEAATVDFVFIMFAGGALAAAVAAGLGASFPVQVVVAVGVAVLLLFSVRPLIKRQFLDGEVDHQIGASALVGRQARVLQSVTDSDGRIKLGGETWSARLAAGTTATVGPGEEVRVIAIHGATAIVSPVPPTDPTTPADPSTISDPTS